MFSTTECIIWSSTAVIESVAIGIVNLATIAVCMKNRSLRKRSMFLVINLAVADMLVGGLAIINLFFSLGMECDLPTTKVSGHFITSFFFFLFPLSSLTNITVISLERLHATFRPFKHRVIKTWVYGVTIAAVWFFAVVASTAVLALQVILKNTRAPFFYFFFWQSLNLICLLVICVSYTSICLKMNRGSHSRQQAAGGRDRKLTKTLFIVTVVSLLMWLPYVVISFLYFTTDIMNSLSSSASHRLNYACIVLYYANSLVNPILYTMKMPEFKRALVSVFRPQRRQDQAIALRTVPSNQASSGVAITAQGPVVQAPD